MIVSCISLSLFGYKVTKLFRLKLNFGLCTTL